MTICIDIKPYNLLWSGTPGSCVDLHPAGGTRSVATGVGGGQQVGRSEVDGILRASLWTGTAASWVDLNPVGAADAQANAVADGQQVGEANIGGVRHACLWTGTSSSFVSLHPVGSTLSVAYGVDSGQQVGTALTGGLIHACLWNGTRDSLVNLNTFLPIGFTRAQAQGVWRNDDMTYIVGYGSNSTTNREEALMWVSRSVAPTSFTKIRGNIVSGNLASLIESDDNRLVVRPGVVLSTSQAPVQIQVDATAPTASPNGFSFSVEASANFGNAQQTISLWNFALGQYELLDSRLVKLTDDVAYVTVRMNPSRFIQPGTRAIRGLVTYRAVGPSLSYPLVVPNRSYLVEFPRIGLCKVRTRPACVKIRRTWMTFALRRKDSEHDQGLSMDAVQSTG